MYSYMHVVVLESYCHLNACQRSAKTRRPKLLYRTCSESIRVSTPHKSFMRPAGGRLGACTLFTYEICTRLYSTNDDTSRARFEPMRTLAPTLHARFSKSLNKS